MSDTKALERALNLVLENDVLCASYGGVFREAAAELVELKRKEVEFDAVYKLAEEINDKNVQLRAELDEALELAEEGWGYASPYFQEKWSFKERLAELKAKAHPERK